jgi:eukaryotic-like serine/threonine-protein kinase
MEDQAVVTMRSPLGTILAARYEIRALLGRGGMGEVFEAVDRHLDRTVAVKILRPELAADRRLGARFRREARTAARLSHPGIVGVHDVGEHAGRVFIVMEFVPGHTLAQVIPLAPLPAASVARIGSQVAAALAHAHGRGVVHRDVAPGNIMLTAAGDAKLLDLGIARAAQGSAGSAGSSGVHGTFAYVAPEQAAGRPTDQRADLYALGVVLAELLTGDPPAPGSWATDRGRVASIAGERFAAVLDRCLAVDPGERFTRAEELARALRTLATSLGAAMLPVPQPIRASVAAVPRSGTAPLPVMRTQRLATRPRRGARLAATLAATAIVLGGAWVVVPALSGLGIPVRPSLTGPDPIPAPAGVAVSSACDGWLSALAELSWVPAEGADAYRILRSEGGGGWQAIDVVVADGSAGTGPDRPVTYVDPELGVALTYRYRVQAMDGPLVSPGSAEAVTETPFLCFT